jgi:hypothetical protein
LEIKISDIILSGLTVITVIVDIIFSYNSNCDNNTKTLIWVSSACFILLYLCINLLWKLHKAKRDLETKEENRSGLERSINKKNLQIEELTTCLKSYNFYWNAIGDIVRHATLTKRVDKLDEIHNIYIKYSNALIREEGFRDGRNENR